MKGDLNCPRRTGEDASTSSAAACHLTLAESGKRAKEGMGKNLDALVQKELVVMKRKCRQGLGRLPRLSGQQVGPLCRVLYLSYLVCEIQTRFSVARPRTSVGPAYVFPSTDAWFLRKTQSRCCFHEFVSHPPQSTSGKHLLQNDEFFRCRRDSLKKWRITRTCLHSRWGVTWTTCAWWGSSVLLRLSDCWGHGASSCVTTFVLHSRTCSQHPCHRLSFSRSIRVSIAMCEREIKDDRAKYSPEFSLGHCWTRTRDVQIRLWNFASATLTSLVKALRWLCKTSYKTNTRPYRPVTIFVQPKKPFIVRMTRCHHIFGDDTVSFFASVSDTICNLMFVLRVGGYFCSFWALSGTRSLEGHVGSAFAWPSLVLRMMWLFCLSLDLGRVGVCGVFFGHLSRRGPKQLWTKHSSKTENIENTRRNHRSRQNFWKTPGENKRQRRKTAKHTVENLYVEQKTNFQ